MPQGRGGFRYRFRFEKTGPMALLGHLDVVREIPRVLRRVDVPMTYTKGFHPKPDMIFSPALSLGVISLDEYVDLRLERDLDPAALAELCAAMTAQSPRGLAFRAAAKLGPEDPALSKLVTGARYVLAFARAAAGGLSAEAILAERCGAAMAAASLPIRREVDKLAKMVDVRAFLTRAEVAGPDALAALARAGLFGDLVAVDVDVDIRGNGSVKSAEVASVLLAGADRGAGSPAPAAEPVAHRAVRLELFARAEDPRAGAVTRFSPLDLARARRPAPAPARPAPAALAADAQ